MYLKLIVGFAPGCSADAAARVLQVKLSELLKQPVVIDNRPGGGGDVGLDALIKSPPDGYTIMFATMGAVSTNQFLTKQGYDPLAEVAPISLSTIFTNVLVVNASSDIKTLADYVKKGKEKNALLHFGSAGIGSIGHLAGELLKCVRGSPPNTSPTAAAAWRPTLEQRLNARLANHSQRCFIAKRDANMVSIPAILRRYFKMHTSAQPSMRRLSCIRSSVPQRACCWPSRPA